VLSLIELKNGELISGGEDGSLRRWRDGKAVGDATPTGQGRAWSLIVLKNGDLISGGGDGSLRRWRDGKAIGAAIPFGHGEFWKAIEHRLCTPISFRQSDEKNLIERTVCSSIPTGQGPVRSLIEINGELITGGEDGTLRRWKNGNAVGAAFPTGQRAVRKLIKMTSGEVVSGGKDGSLRFFLMPKDAIREACKELQEHPFLLSPKTPVEQKARKTCIENRFLSG
jgi:hypothetical protein